MNTPGRFADGRFLTTGEKAFVVMLVAGLFGYWAGFNLSAPGSALTVPVAAAAASAPAAADRVPAAAKFAGAHDGADAAAR